MVKTTTLKEVLAYMRSAKKFDIEVCTADGDRSIYKGAMQSGARFEDEEPQAAGVGSDTCVWRRDCQRGVSQLQAM